jgi:hypothetical protein
MTIILDDYTPETATRSRETVSARDARTGKVPAKVHPYYDFGPLLSHHAEYNFLVGGRGLGKTYGAKRRAVKRNLTHGEEFIYLRRYKEELAASRDTFFDDVAHEFPEWDFRNVGNVFQKAPVSTRDDKKRDWEVIGYSMALSKGQEKKSVALPRVKTIIFDEFIIEKGVIRYLPNEAVVFNNFYSTVDRWQDKTTVFFLANAISIGNPYFVYYKIIPEEGEEWLKLDVGKAKGFILCHFPKSEDFARSVSATRFGQMIDGSDYADYAIGNEFHDNTLALLGIKNPRSRHMFNLETSAGMFSIWHDVFIDEYYAYSRIPPGQTTITLLIDGMDDEKIFLLPTSPILKRLFSAFKHRRLKFEDQSVRERWFDMMRPFV